MNVQSDREDLYILCLLATTVASQLHKRPEGALQNKFQPLFCAAVTVLSTLFTCHEFTYMKCRKGLPEGVTHLHEGKGCCGLCFSQALAHAAGLV